MRTIADLDELLAAAEEELAGLDRRRTEILRYIEALRREKSVSVETPSTATSPDGPIRLPPLPDPSPMEGAGPDRPPDATLYDDPRSEPASKVTDQSPAEEKIALFRSLFRGREDVYPRRFESRKTGKSGYLPACRNEWIKPRCRKPRMRCGECPNREFLPVTDEVVENHLLGGERQGRSKRDFAIGVYPLLPGESCRFLAVDFDKSGWREDAAAFLKTCAVFGVPAALERSRSGNGGHVWIFFTAPVDAGTARRMGSFMLTETMESRPEMGLDSYDRFFPSQDTLPRGGFGSLIALPLQRRPRETGNSVFVDEAFVPFPDQWAYLSSVRRMEPGEVENLAQKAVAGGRVMGVRTVVTDEDDDPPWTRPPSGRRKELPLPGPLPPSVTLTVANQVYVAKVGLSPALRNRLIRLAAFQNPEFYKAQAMRLPTFQIPRVIGCCEDFPDHLGLPRGCLEETAAFLSSIGIAPVVVDERFGGIPIDVRFTGTLRPDQEPAARAMLENDTGVLSATTAFGKTVVAARLIADRGVNTLVLVHRRELLDQWGARLNELLELPSGRIGRIGGGKRDPTGIVDVAIIQSLVRKGVVDDLVAEYGHLVVDECHHISARSFETVARQCRAKYVTGLSATVTRKDGHHPIIFMQCGPVRHHVDERRQAAARPFCHGVIPRQTEFLLPGALRRETDPAIHEVYAALARDEKRNGMIVRDVLDAVAAGRFPVILTERREHLSLLAQRLVPHVRNVVVLQGGMGKKQRAAAAKALAGSAEGEARVIVATGRYLGEGFDDASLDTLFLALPVSWRGVLVQYAGRLHRLHEQKKDVLIYDYADLRVPMLARMYGRRRMGYRKIGYAIQE